MVFGVGGVPQMETAKTGLTEEAMEDALAGVPDVVFLLIGDIYYTVCCDAFEFHTVPEKKRARAIDVHLKSVREHPGRPFLVGREMTRPEQGRSFDSRGSAIVSALEQALVEGKRRDKDRKVFDIRLIAYTPLDAQQDPFAYYAKPDERELFGVLYDRGLIRFEGNRIAAVTQRLLEPLRTCVADRMKVVEQADYGWEDVFSPELNEAVFRFWQESLAL